MKVPHADIAIVSREKIIEYLLNPSHPDGAGKAAFFVSLGFSAVRWQVLADVLLEMVGRFEAAGRMDSVHGTKYIVDGEIATPSGRTVSVRIIWIIDAGHSSPRLVTVYPRKGA